MFEEVKIEEKLKDNMKDDEELELLLGEIPHAIHHTYSIRNAHHHHNGHGDHGSNVMNGMMMMMMGSNSNGVCMYDEEPLNHPRYTCASPVSGFSLQSDGSSSSLFSGGHSLSDNGSPTPPPLEELKPHLVSGSSKNFNGLLMDSKAPDSSVGKNMNDNITDEVVLSRNLSKMYISDQQDDVPIGLNDFHPRDQSVEGAFRMNSKCMPSVNYRNGLFDYGGSQSSVPRGFQNFNGDMAYCFRLGNLPGSQYSPVQSDGPFCPSNCVNPAMSSQFHGTMGQAGPGYQMGIPLTELSTTLARSSVTDAVLYTQQTGINPYEKRGAFCSPNMPHVANLRPHFDVDNGLHFQQPLQIGRNKVFSHVRIPQRGLEAFAREESLIIQGEGVNCVMNKGYGRPRGQNVKAFFQEVSMHRHQEKRSQLDNHPQIAGIQENGRNARMHCAFSLPAKCTSLAEAQGYIYCIAKDQHGCRFLQRMFDEGTPRDVQIIFNEIIDHVVELMMNPFGNYLMQKLLEVCNEEQRMHILLKVTQEPGELVRISLNTHGTRVVQKLIETLKTRHQISLVISALEPGFLALIKDLNGNHVVQRCLQCLNNEDNKFIFVAAAKYCVDIATHQHGCCVLQRCISHSTGEHRETLVAEISANGLLLAQDAFGNYVVQFILELKIPTATSKLVSQFEGSYVHLSMQKFSSHVVEKCLAVCNDQIRSKIILELLSATHFEQLLQDPHANYVVQTALRVSEGPLHNSLVDGIETHRAVSRNSPYSKRIFSHKLLKK